MKKLLTVLVVAAMMLSLCITASATRDLVYEAPYGTAVIDGEVDDAWKNAGWTEIDLPYSAGGKLSVCSARAKVMHDDTYVYVLCELTDATVAENNGDFLEFYMDEDACFDADEMLSYCEQGYQLRCAIYGDDAMGINGTDLALEDLLIKKVVKTTDSGYVMEFQVKTINAPAAGTSMGMEFMYNDQDESAAFLDALRWNADTANGDTPPWQSAASFGRVNFNAAPVVETPAEVEAPAAEEAAAVVEEAPAAEAAAETVVAPSTPKTADAGVVVAVAVMALAAGVVLTKKH